MHESVSENQKGNMIQCASCGAQFDEMLPECPYCGNASIKGAQAEYMEKLEAVRSDMAALGQAPMEETKKELKKQGRFTISVLIIIAAVVGLLFAVSFMYYNEDRDRRKDYEWQLKNYPVLNELYEQGEYEELLVLYEKACEEDAPIYDWEHWEFCSVLHGFLHVESILELEKSGAELTHWDYEDLLYFGFRAKWMEQNSSMPEEELQKLEPYVQMVLTDWENRWDFTEEELAAFEKELQENYGSISFKSCEKYIAGWLERRTKQ